MRRDHERELERDDRRGRIFSFDVTKLGRWVASFFSRRRPYKPRIQPKKEA